MKSFEQLVLSHLKAITDPLLDPLQFTYRTYRSMDNAVNMASTLSTSVWTTREPMPCISSALATPRLCSFSATLLSIHNQPHLHSASGQLLKFADEREIDHLLTWFSQNNLKLKALKTVEIVDFKKNPASPAEDPKWQLNINFLSSSAQHRMSSDSTNNFVQVYTVIP